MPSSSVYKAERSGEGFPLPAGKERTIMMKTWKRLVSGLLGLTLAASLACPALAAEGSAKTAAKEEPKAEAAAEQD